MYWGEDAYTVRRTPRWRLTPVTPPSDEPITLAEAKQHLEIDHDDKNGQIIDWIRAATRKVEQDTEVALLTQTWDLTLSGFPEYVTEAIPLPLRPVQSITHVKYYTALGVLTTVTNTDYFLDVATASVALAVDKVWPTDLRPFQPGTIRFVAGYTSPDLVPDDLKHAVKLLVGHFSEARQAAQIDRPQAIDYGYDALIAPYVRHLAA